MRKRLDVSRTSRRPDAPTSAGYDHLLSGLTQLLASARHASARVVNALMTATYWEIGRRVVEYEQGGDRRAIYGEQLLERLASDLTRRFGRGFSYPNVNKFRQFYLTHRPAGILSPAPGESEANLSTLSRELAQEVTQAMTAGPGAPARDTADRDPRKPAADLLTQVAASFPLPWSAYVRLLSVKAPEARTFYEAEALRGGWSVRQLDRQIASQFYERTALSRNKAAMLKKGERPTPADIAKPEQEIKDPLVLEFLDLKDEYSETNLEEALIRHLEQFLLELGSDFAFMGRQKRLRIGNEWYRIDLLFFHRRLRCLVVIDLKVGKFTHADAGQMHLYLNYARERWAHPGENPPVGLILCAEKDAAVAKYALSGLPNQVLAAEYKLALPDEKALAAEIEQTRRMLRNERTP